jgi:putative flippase GtrA
MIIRFFVPERFVRPVRYLIAGGTAAATNLVALYVFTDLLHVWYLLSAILSFLIAFIVSFVLQKFWTFTGSQETEWKSQAVMYFIITSINLGLNTLLMYLFVDIFDIHYMVSQFIISGLIACESYFVYQIFVFKKKKDHAQA